MRQFYIFYADAFFIALKSILEHKLRAFLTLLGVIIGVASVIVVSASISGLNSYVMEKITKVLGANHFMINRMAHSGEMDDEEFERRNKRNKKITWEEYASWGAAVAAVWRRHHERLGYAVAAV